MLFWPFKHSQQQSMNTFLIVGLGNIGIDYKNTRHNIGFAVLDALSTKFNVSFSTLRYGNLAEISHEGRKIILLKPSTLMNRSGQAVRYWAKQKKINLQKDNLAVLILAGKVNLPNYNFKSHEYLFNIGNCLAFEKILKNLNCDSETKIYLAVSKLNSEFKKFLPFKKVTFIEVGNVMSSF